MKNLLSSTKRATPRATVCVTLFIFLITFLLSSCGFQGRKYTRWHYWEGRNDIEYGYTNPEKNQKQKENEKEEQNPNKKESEKESEKDKEIEIAIEIDSKSNVKDTLKNSSIGKNSRISLEQEGQLYEKQDFEGDENKLRKAKNGFITTWVIESLFYLGLLGNAYSPDAWALWLVVFAILTAFYLFLTLIYLSILKSRYAQSKDQIKDELLKARIPKLIRAFSCVIFIEVGLLILAFIIGGNM
jgi:hypothetical protein